MNETSFKLISYILVFNLYIIPFLVEGDCPVTTTSQGLPGNLIHRILLYTSDTEDSGLKLDRIHQLLRTIIPYSYRCCDDDKVKRELCFDPH